METCGPQGQMCLLAGTPLVPVETLLSLLDWMWGQAMREGSHHERLSQEELKLPSVDTSSPCAHGSLIILAPVLVGAGRLARRGEVHLVTRRGCSSWRSPGPEAGSSSSFWGHWVKGS